MQAKQKKDTPLSSQQAITSWQGTIYYQKQAKEVGGLTRLQLDLRWLSRRRALKRQRSRQQRPEQGGGRSGTGANDSGRFGRGGRDE